MIINSIIAGAGNIEEAIISEYENTIGTLNVSTIFSNFDIRFAYKSSIMILYVAPKSAGNVAYPIKMLIIPNTDNFNNATGYDAIMLYRPSTNANIYWGALTNASRETISISSFSANATTGRISSTYTTRGQIPSGAKIYAIEVPVSPAQGAIIDTTPWGTT